FCTVHDSGACSAYFSRLIEHQAYSFPPYHVPVAGRAPRQPFYPGLRRPDSGLFPAESGWNIQRCFFSPLYTHGDLAYYSIQTKQTMNKVIKYVIYDIVRNRFVLSYTLLLLFTSLAFYGFGADGNKGVLSLLNIILMVVPLVSIVFTTIQFYNSYEFLELLSAQPISRKTIFM